MHALSCIACGKPLVNVTEDSINQPYVGTSFSSHGHYGSTVWDPMDGELLEINVCDTCLLRAGEADRVLRYRPAQKTARYLAPVPWREDDPLILHHARKENEKKYGSAFGADEPYVPAYEDVSSDPFATEGRDLGRSQKKGEIMTDAPESMTAAEHAAVIRDVLERNGYPDPDWTPCPIVSLDALAKLADDLQRAFDTEVRVCSARTTMLEEAKAALRAVEWSGYAYIGIAPCPACAREHSEGHADDCPIHAVLKEKS